MVLFQDGWHACYISYSIESLNGTMVEMVEYHNGFLSQDGFSMYVTSVTLLVTSVTLLVTFSR